MKSTHPMNPVHPMTIEAAYDYASRLVESEQRGSDVDTALRRIEQRYGISPNQIVHLRSRRAKTCDLGLFGRLRSAYLDLCERQMRRLQNEIAIEKATQDDADIRDLEAAAADLAAKIAARKEALKRTA